MSAYRRSNFQSSISNSISCPKCLKIALPNHKFCMDCGTTFVLQAEVMESVGKTCPKCLKIALPNHRFCMDCGTTFPRENAVNVSGGEKKSVSVGGLVCPTCGRDGRSGYRFCDKDGTRLEMSSGSGSSSVVSNVSTPPNVRRGSSRTRLEMNGGSVSVSTAPVPTNTTPTQVRRGSSVKSEEVNTTDEYILKTDRMGRSYRVKNPDYGKNTTNLNENTITSNISTTEPTESKYKSHSESSTTNTVTTPTASRYQSSKMNPTTPTKTESNSAQNLACPTCGKDGKAGYKFCDKDGTRLELVARVPTSTTTTSTIPKQSVQTKNDVPNTNTNKTPVTTSSTNRYRGNSTSISQDQKTPTVSPTANRYKRNSAGKTTTTKISNPTESLGTPKRNSASRPNRYKRNSQSEETLSQTETQTAPVPIIEVIPEIKFAQEPSSDSDKEAPEPIKKRRKLTRKMSRLVEQDIQDEEELKRKEQNRIAKLTILNEENNRDNFVSSSIESRKIKRAQTLNNYKKKQIEEKKKKMEQYWESVFEEDVDENIQTNLIQLSYQLGVVNDEPQENLPENFVRTDGGYAPEADKFMEQMKEALEINLKAMGIEEDELKNTVDNQKSLLDKVMILEKKLAEVKLRDSSFEQEKIYNELQSEIQSKFESFEKQMLETQERINSQKDEQNNEDEIHRLERSLHTIESKMEQQMNELNALQQEREQRRLDEMAERANREREQDRQAEVLRIQQKLREDEERRIEKDKHVYEQLVAMETRLKETESALKEQDVKSDTNDGLDGMQKYLQEMEKRLQEQERKKQEELNKQEEKIRQLEAALTATQNQLELEKRSKQDSPAPQINLDGEDIMGSIELLMARMMGSKMSQLESKIKGLESRAISGGGPVRDYEAIKQEIDDLQALLFDPDTPEIEIKRINIEFEKLMGEYERTPEYQEELRLQKEEWNDLNEPLNNECLMEVKSKLLNIQATNKTKYIQKIKDNPLMKIIVLDKEQIISKHANDWKQISFGDCQLKHLRALYAALPTFRNDQTVQIAIVENLKQKIDDMVANPKPYTKKKKRVVRDPNLPPPPPPPPSTKTVITSSGGGDFFEELLARRNRLE